MKTLALNRSQHFKVPTAILGASLSSDSKLLAAACMDGIYLADLSTGTHEQIGRHSSYVSSVAFLPCQSTVVSGGYDGMLQWIHVAEKQMLRQVRLHEFWSWDMKLSPDGSLAASATGQYLAGGYKYEPQAEKEPSIRIVNTESGEIVQSLSHTPSVQSVAFSPDGEFVAAGNLMGEVRVWSCHTGEQKCEFKTPDFTSWGIIKSHCYLGGIFALHFTPDGKQLLLAGMGPMKDPMAGNGRQLWQKWSWCDSEPVMVDETHAGESGEGLMETLAIHPTGEYFVMAGRLRGGDWNAALFDLKSGHKLTSLKTGYRITQALFTSDGSQLVLAGTQGQPGKMESGVFPNFGRVEVYDVTAEEKTSGEQKEAGSE
ncbi:MAG: hypothetical protein KDA91_17650 [Planctomycetaceae bacterium]|nr:hypothetical protein [Planctomycetaceae bacterium]